jgi:ketosteroid isomerase-like protein
MADPDGVRQWLDTLLAACNAHDVEALVDCFADDYVNETPAHPARGFHGREQVRHNWTSIFAGVPDVEVRLVRAAIDGPTLWAEMAMDGTRRDGTRHGTRGVVIFIIGHGRATHARFYLEPIEYESGGVNAFIARSVGVSTS